MEKRLFLTFDVPLGKPREGCFPHRGIIRIGAPNGPRQAAAAALAGLDCASAKAASPITGIDGEIIGREAAA